MRHAPRLLLLAALLAYCPFAVALADPGAPVPVRVGNHPGFGRVVFDLPARLDYHVTQQGDHVVVEFTGDVTIGSVPAMPTNVLAITGGASKAELVVAPGTVVHDARYGDRVVIDVLDKSAAAGLLQVKSPPQKPAPQADGAPNSSSPPSSLRAKSPPQKPSPQADSTPGSASPPSSPQVSPPPQKPPPQADSTPDRSGPQSGPLAKPPPQKPTPQPASAPERASPQKPGKPAADAMPGTPAPPGASAPQPDKIATAGPQPASTPQQSVVATPQPEAPAATLNAAQSTAAAAATADATPTPASTPPPAPQSAPVAPVTTEPEPAEPTAKPSLPLVVPFSAPLGVAAFRRGNTAFVVFDQRQPIDTAPLRDDPVLRDATVQMLAAATVVRVALDRGMALSVSREPHAWRIIAVPSQPRLRPIQTLPRDGHLAFMAAAPGGVVNISDLETGTTLLVGTQREPGQGIAVRRRAVEFSLLPTWQGIAIDPLADNLTLRPTEDGFQLTAGTSALALSPPLDPVDLLAHAAGLTRRFDFPKLSTDASMQRLRRLVDEEAATPALARGPRRRATAQAMMGLGLGPEAQALLQAAAADDPREAAAPDNAALTSMAAVLAHRPDEADGLNEPAVSGADDIALWRALRLAQLDEGSPQAAALLSASMPLLFTYPAALRDHLLPLAAETLVAGGETASASALLSASKDDPGLAMARGMLKAAQGKTAEALAIYDRSAQSSDRWEHAQAAVRAVELRLASGKFDAKQAADALDKLLYVWRGDIHERTLRERVAELRARTGAWRQALGLLRDTEALFPDDKVAIHAELTDMFTAMLREDAEDALAPLELAALAEENADLLPDGPAGEVLEARLADRLLALDLPKRAGAVLEKLMQAAPTATGRATFGARLAALRQREGDSPGALSALADTASDDLPPDLVERRTLLLAEADAHRGNTDKALAALGSLNTAAADEARAGILERGNDWPAAEKALTDYSAKTVPAQGKLDDGQRRTLLRLATAAARAGDDVTLTALRQRETTRMETGPLADMFRLLTADQVRSVADLKRSGQEAVLARRLPDGLKALQPPARPSP